MADAPARPIRLGIAWRLSLVVAAVALGPLVVTGQRLVSAAVESMHAAARELQLAVVADVRRTVHAEVGAGRGELDALADLLLGEGYGSDDQRITVATARIKASERIEWLAVYAPSGERLGGWRKKGEGQAGLPERLPVALGKALSEARRATGDVVDLGGRPGLLLATRVRQGADGAGPEVGTAVAALDLSGLCDALEDIATKRFEDLPDAVYVIDAERKLVAHPDEALAAGHGSRAGRGFLATVGTGAFGVPLGLSPEFTLPSGERRLGALESIPELGWAVVVEMSQARAYAAAGAMRRSMLIGALAAGAAGLLLAFGAGRQLARPIRALAAATRKLATRDYTAHVDVSRTDELGQLASDFNQMVGDLKASEDKVVQETRMRTDLSRFMAPDVVEQVMNNPDLIKLGGERREVTVMFADIVAFTGLAERIEPETTVAILNELFTIAREIIHRNGGIVDKFIGDCVMAVFGAPRAGDNDAVAAIRTAEDLVRWLDAGNRRWRKTYNIELQLAIGINTGPAVAGYIGSEKQLQYTVIGDTVNVAARLEVMAKPGQILISQATRDRIGDEFGVEAAGLHNLTGRAATTMVFALDVG